MPYKLQAEYKLQADGCDLVNNSQSETLLRFPADDGKSCVARFPMWGRPKVANANEDQLIA